MKRFLLLFLIVCLSFSLFSCAKQNANNGSTATQASTNTDTAGDAYVSTDSDSSILGEPSTDTPCGVKTNNDTPKAKNGEISEENMEEFVLKGIVLGISDKLEIEVIESDYAFGVYHVIVPSTIPITDKNGANISLSDLKANDTVLVAYSGQTMLSYPPQIVAYSIVVQ